jgi:hypothetical protein
MLDGRRKSNGRFRDASAQLALCRLHWGQYRTIAQLASDMDVGELTVRDWLAWWRQAWAVDVARGDDGIMYVAESGAIDMDRLRAWVESGHAFDGAVYMGSQLPPGYAPPVEREWPEIPRPLSSPVFTYRKPQQAPVVRPAARPAIPPPPGAPEPLYDEDGTDLGNLI